MNQELEDHIDSIIDLVSEIPEGKISILVGSNGSGKSLIRKQLSGRFKTAQTSMEQRTSSNPEWGGLSPSVMIGQLEKSKLKPDTTALNYTIFSIKKEENDSAFESDIHGTGGTKSLEKLRWIKVEKALIKHKEY